MTLKKLSPKEKENCPAVWVCELRGVNPELWGLISELLGRYADEAFMTAILTAALAPFYNNDEEKFSARIPGTVVVLLRRRIRSLSSIPEISEALRQSEIKEKNKASRRLDIFCWKQARYFFGEDPRTVEMRDVAYAVYLMIFLAEHLAEESQFVLAN